MPTARIYIIRHGETEANRQQIIQGQLDTELNAAGIEQAQLTSHALEDIPFFVAYSSDLQRARKTAEIILAKRSNVDLQTSEDLRERYMGDLQGQPLSHLRSVSPANVESPSAFASRVMRCWNRIVQRHVSSAKKSELQTPIKILVTTHGGFIGTLMQCLIGSRKVHCGKDVQIGKCLNASITVVDLEDDGKGELVSFSATTHLTMKLVEVNADIVANKVTNGAGLVDNGGGGGDE